MGEAMGPWVSAAGALAVVLGLLWIAARAVAPFVGRVARGGGATAGPLGTGLLGTGGARRLRVVETAPIDGRRRAVILRVDGREALVVTGGAQELFLGWL